MTERRDDNPDPGSASRRQGGDPVPGVAGDRPKLGEFRRRVDSFWGDPRAADLRRTLIQGGRKPRRLPPASALRSRLRDTLEIVESRPRQAEFRLEKSLTLRDGQLISISGDERPLAPEDRILVVTTTTTVTDSDYQAVETNVLVFEREA